jgi:hypothetical protein
VGGALLKVNYGPKQQKEYVMQQLGEKAGAIILVLLIAGCTSQGARPAPASLPDARDQRQEEQRKQDRQQHEMERGELRKGDRFVSELERT